MCLSKPLEFLLNMFLNQFQMVIVFCHTHILTIYNIIYYNMAMSNDHSMIQQESPLCCIFCHVWPHFKGRQVASSSTKRTRSDGAGTGGSGGSGGAAKTGLSSSSSSSRAPMTMDGMSWTANDVCLASPPTAANCVVGKKHERFESRPKSSNTGQNESTRQV